MKPGMKITASVFAAAVLVVLGSVFIMTGRTGSKDHNSVSHEKITYRCPMHPAYTSDKLGDCPICGMKLVAAESKASEARAVSSSSMPSAAKEKTLQEVCIEHKCTVKDCPMMVRANIKPGERMMCPVCGEVIGTENGKVIEISRPKEASPSSMAQALPSAEKKERKILYYRNPMNAEITSPVPMKDSMGMDYVPVYEPQASSGASVGPSVMISPERQQLIGVKTQTVKVINLAKIVRASGKIAYDPELAVTQEEFIQALNSEDKVKDSPLADVIERAKSLTEATRNKLRLLGMGPDQISKLEKNRKVDTGLYLPGKGESVWAYISVYEYEIGLIKADDLVDIEAIAYPGESFPGRVGSVNPVLDSANRTNQVRVEVANLDDKLKPEMFVNASIKVDLGERLAVPESAVLDTGLRTIVYVSRENVIESREVRLGRKAQGYYEVLSGVNEGEVVVTSGNFLVDSESKLQAPIQSAGHEHTN